MDLHLRQFTSYNQLAIKAALEIVLSRKHQINKKIRIFITQLRINNRTSIFRKLTDQQDLVLRIKIKIWLLEVLKRACFSNSKHVQVLIIWCQRVECDRKNIEYINSLYPIATILFESNNWWRNKTSLGFWKRRGRSIILTFCEYYFSYF